MIAALPGVTGNFVTLGDGASLQGLVIQDVVRPALTGGSVVVVSSRNPSDSVSAQVAECRDHQRQPCDRPWVDRAGWPRIDGDHAKPCWRRRSGTARAVTGLGSSHTIHHPLARWWGRHLRHQHRQRKPHRAALAPERRRQAWRQRRDQSARLDGRCVDVDSVDGNLYRADNVHVDHDRLATSGRRRRTDDRPPDRRRDTEQQALDALR